MNNISSILSTHNKDILNPTQTSFGCSRRSKDHCPLDGECLTPNIIYRGDITTGNDHKFYYGTSETAFKNVTVIILVILNMSNTNMLLNLLNRLKTCGS